MKKYIYKINHKLYLLLFTILALTISCEDSNLLDGIREVTFKPTASTILITEGESITYKDSSLYVKSRMWTFPGGNIPTSDQEVVSVTYNKDGVYNTKLAVNHTDGTTKSNEFQIKVFKKVIADFSADKNAALFGSKITFTNLSQNTASAYADAQAKDSYLWEFEGGVPATSTAKDPVVTYPIKGLYKVKLTVHREDPKYDAVVVKPAFINIVDVQVISPKTITLVGLGSKIIVEYPAELLAIAASKFQVKVDGAANIVKSIVTNVKKYELTLTTPVVEDQIITISYGGGDFAKTGELLAPILNTNVPNTVINVLKNTNPGFETGPTGTFPPSWGNWDGSRNNPEVYSVINTDKNEGSQSLLVNMNGSGNGWIFEGTPAPVARGNYRLSVWAKASVAGVDLDFRCIAPDWSSVSSSNATLTTQWQQYSIDFSTTNDNTLSRKYWHQLIPKNYPAGTKVYVDGITLYRID
jgi:PKD repeat protein